MRKLWVLVALVSLPKTALAYEVLGAVWQNATSPGVTYCPVSNSQDANTSTKVTQFLTAVTNAAETWGNDPTLGAPCSALNVVNGTGTGACSGTPSESSSKPWVFWVQNWSSLDGLGPSTIGVTPWVSQGSRIVQAKIMFNDQNYTWTTSTSGVQTDVQSIAAHEFGHFFGLDHYDEFSSTKRNQCTNNASYPAVMCAFYDGDLVRVLTSDDIQGICYLYPDNGALGSTCDNGTDCDSDECHPDGYCTEVCGTCDPGYSCVSNLCERDVPTPSCTVCPGIACDGDSTCVGASGGALCTESCSAGNPCPAGYGCVPLEDGGNVCYPYGNTCDDGAPEAGEPCDGGATCALGNICLNDGTASGGCYAVCEDVGDCGVDEECIELDAGLSYCDVAPECEPCGTLACGSDPVCLDVDDGAMCAPGCEDNSDCPKAFFCAELENGDGACYPLSFSCETTGPGPGQACTNDGACRLGNLCIDDTCFVACRSDSDCDDDEECQATTEAGVGFCDEASSTGCACDTSSACTSSCVCDDDCGSNEPECACDVDTACSADCACDVECDSCACDVSTACDADCDACDPECQGGCSCGPRSQAGPENLWGMGLGLLLVVLQGKLRRRRGSLAT